MIKDLIVGMVMYDGDKEWYIRQIDREADKVIVENLYGTISNELTIEEALKMANPKWLTSLSNNKKSDEII